MPTVTFERGGQLLDLEAGLANQAIKEGWKPIDSAGVQEILAKREAGSISNQAISFAEGAGRGLTFGLSDLALSETLGPEYAKNAALRKEVNPVAATTGEIAGVVAPTLLSGGSGAVGSLSRLVSTPVRALETVGAATAKNVLSTTGSKVLASSAKLALEGAAFGAGNKISEAALGNPERIAEHLTATLPEGILEGALSGAVLGAGLGVAGKAITGAVSKVPALDEWANTLAVRSMGGTVGQYRGLGKTIEQQNSMVQRMGKRAFEEGIIGPTTSAEEMLNTANRVIKESGKELENLTREIESKSATRIDRLTTIKRMQDEVLRPLQESAFDRKAAKTIEKDIENIFDNLNKDNSFNSVWETQKQMGKSIFKETTGEFKSAIDRERYALQKILKEELSSAAEKASEEAGENIAARWKLENSRYSELKKIQMFLSGDVARGMNKSGVGIRELMAGVAGAAASPILGPVGMATSYLTKEYGDQALASMLRSFSSLSGIQSKVATYASTLEEKALSAIESKNVPNKLIYDRATAINTVESIRRFANDPYAIQDTVTRVVAPLSESAPAIAAMVATNLATKLSYLTSKLPRSSIQETLTPGQEKSRYTDADLQRFMKTYWGTAYPHHLVDEVKSGKISPEVREAVKATSPNIYADIQKAAMGAITAKGRKLSYSEKLKAQSLLGVVPDPTFQPSFIRKLQEFKAPKEDKRPVGRPHSNPKQNAFLYDSPSTSLARKF